MKKQKQDAGGNPDNEIEVTPEMIEAGIRELFGFDPEWESGAEVVERIYAAMGRVGGNRFPTKSGAVLQP